MVLASLTLSGFGTRIISWKRKRKLFELFTAGWPAKASTVAIQLTAHSQPGTMCTRGPGSPQLQPQPKVFLPHEMCLVSETSKTIKPKCFAKQNPELGSSNWPPNTVGRQQNARLFNYQISWIMCGFPLPFAISIPVFSRKFLHLR